MNSITQVVMQSSSIIMSSMWSLFLMCSVDISVQGNGCFKMAL